MGLGSPCYGKKLNSGGSKVGNIFFTGNPLIPVFFGENDPDFYGWW